MKKTFLFILITLFIGIQKNYAQEKLNENQKLETLCKVWGFLKYYHPIVAKGTYNWDNQLIEKIKESEKIDTKKQFNKMLSSWIESLGKVEICTTCNQKNDKEYFLKNFDLSWTDDENIFSKDVIEKLNFIEENRNKGENFYIEPAKMVGNAVVKNEFTYDNFPEKEKRLVELFKYWNLIEYFFPYKYQTNQKWNDVLSEIIPKIINSKSLTDYQIALLELVTKIDDSHGFLYSENISNFFGKKYLNFVSVFVDNQLVIKKKFDNKLGINNDFKVGDIISKVNDKTMSERIEELSKYIPASNQSVKYRNAKRKNLIFRGDQEEIKLTIIRDGISFEKKYKRLTNKDLVIDKNEKDSTKWNFIENNIAYVNLEFLKTNDVNKMYNEIKNTNYLILDLRNYPKHTAWPLSNKFLPNRMANAKNMAPDFTYPGKFIFHYDYIGKDNNDDFYKGKIIVLVNETTQSQAEYSAMMFQLNKGSKVIGSQTAGADGNIVRLKLGNLDTSFSGLGVFYPDGRETQRIGIVPDIEVKPTIKGIKEGRDEVLERALEYIRTGK